LGVYAHARQTRTAEVARTKALAVPVFAELLRAFGARRGHGPRRRIPLRTNLQLLAVVAVAFGR